MKDKKSVLVALIPNKNDWQIVNDKKWYRIPKEKAPLILKKNQLKYIAFYFPAIFGENLKWRITHYAKVSKIIEKVRHELFPEEK
mgnify:FL=1